MSAAGIAAGVAAVPAQHVDLAGDHVGRTLQVGTVGEAGRERQRAPLATAADPDRHVLLQRPRVRQRLAGGERPSGERRRPLAPERRQRAERVLEGVVACGEPGEGDPGGGVFGGEPADPQPAHRPPARHHVEGGDRLGEQRRRTQEGRRHQHAEPHPLRAGGDPGERRERVRQVVPRCAELRDLAEVVHQPHVLHAGPVGLADHPPQRLGEGLRPPGQSNVESISPTRIVPVAAGSPAATGVAPTGAGRRRVVARERGRHDGNGFRFETASHASARTSSWAAGQRRSCAETVASGTRASRDALRRRHSAAGVSNTTADRGHVVVGGQLAPPRPHRRVEAEGVDGRGQASAHPTGHDVVEHGEGVVRRGEIVR